MGTLIQFAPISFRGVNRVVNIQEKWNAAKKNDLCQFVLGRDHGFWVSWILIEQIGKLFAQVVSQLAPDGWMPQAT
jgi:hypothetical protein